MKKRISALSLAFLIVFALLPLSAYAAEETVTDSQGVTYTLSDDGKYYTVSSFDNSVAEVVISSEIDGVAVASIGSKAFRNCGNLESVVIPNSVTSIGEYAFYYCKGLISVIIPDSVISIGGHAFDACTELTSIVIPDSVTSIGVHAFYNCDEVTSIVIPASVTSIGAYAFGNGFCNNLTSITVDSKNTTYHSKDNCLIETATNTLLQGCNNSIIPNYVTSINTIAFANCTGLTSIVIPNSVSSIGDYAFSYCKSLASIEIPNSVSSIGDYAFYGCTNLTDIYCEAESQPEGWEASWLKSCDATVHWGYDPNRKAGDCNGDGDVDKKDYALLKRYCFGTYELDEQALSCADVNGDGEIDKKDYALIKRHCFGTYTIK